MADNYTTTQLMRSLEKLSLVQTVTETAQSGYNKHSEGFGETVPETPHSSMASYLIELRKRRKRNNSDRMAPYFNKFLIKARKSLEF